MAEEIICIMHGSPFCKKCNVCEACHVSYFGKYVQVVNGCNISVNTPACMSGTQEQLDRLNKGGR